MPPGQSNETDDSPKEKALYIELPADEYHRIEKAVEEENRYANKKQLVEIAIDRELSDNEDSQLVGHETQNELAKEVDQIQDSVTDLGQRLNEIKNEINKVKVARDVATDEELRHIASVARDYIPLVESVDEYEEPPVVPDVDAKKKALSTGATEHIITALQVEEGMDVSAGDAKRALTYLAESVARVKVVNTQEFGRCYVEIEP